MPFNRSRAPADGSPGGHEIQPRSLFAGVPAILVLVAGLILLVLLILNSRFMASVAACRVYYPNATIVSEEQPYFLQPFGSLAVELYSPDAPQVVTDWYNQTHAAEMRLAIERGDLRDTGSINWQVTPADDGGSRILVLCP